MKHQIQVKLTQFLDEVCQLLEGHSQQNPYQKALNFVSLKQTDRSSDASYTDNTYGRKNNNGVSNATTFFIGIDVTWTRIQVSGAGMSPKCWSYLILISRIRGHAEIFIFLSIFFSFLRVNSVYKVITYFMHNLIVLTYLFCELKLLNTLSK